jgi:hypothetical protein
MIRNDSFQKNDLLTVLDLSQNRLDSNGLELNCFRGLAYLIMLNLSHNYLEIVYREWFNDFLFLNELYLDHNNVKSIEKSPFSNVENLLLFLPNNFTFHLREQQIVVRSYRINGESRYSC